MPGKTGVLGTQQLAQAPAHWKDAPPPNPHHGMAQSGAGFRVRARCKPPGGVTDGGRWHQQGSVGGLAVRILPAQYIALTHETP